MSTTSTGAGSICSGACGGDDCEDDDAGDGEGDDDGACILLEGVVFLTFAKNPVLLFLTASA